VSFTARNPTRRTPLRHQSKQSTDRAVVLLGPPRLVAGLFRAGEMKAHRRKGNSTALSGNLPHPVHRPNDEMNRAPRTRPKLSWAVFAGFLLLSGCGSPSSSHDGQPATSAAVEPSFGGGTAGGQPMGGSGVPMPAPAGRITITVSAPSYGPGQVVSATIANGLDKPVFTTDSKSDCSIAILEREEADTWNPILTCMVRRPPVTVAIGSSRGRTVLINLSNLAALGTPLEAGIYRLTFTYGLGREQGREPLVAHSPTFEIMS